MSARDLVVGEALLDDDENEDELVDDYDGEGDERRADRGADHYDSSEEDEEEDDDEEAAKAVCEGLMTQVAYVSLCSCADSAHNPGSRRFHR
jgi:transcription elongation factor SPT6